MPTMVGKIMRLSATFPPIFTTYKPNIDPFISSCKNVLSINLVENQPRNPTTTIENSDNISGYPKQVLREDLTSKSVRLELAALKASQGPVRGVGPRNSLLIRRIRKLALEDAAKQPEDRIDCVEIGPDPWPEHLRALDGLSPKHLKVGAGDGEQIDVSVLDKLKTKFKLESLFMSYVITDWSCPIPTSKINPSSGSSVDPTPSKPQYTRRFPKFFTHVRSLTLEYCLDIAFKGTNLPAHLQQLKIIGNNAIDMFIYAVDNMPKASEQLEKVFIYTDPEYDFSLAFGVEDFRERLAKCKGLKEFTLIIAGDRGAMEESYAFRNSQLAPGEPEYDVTEEGPFDVELGLSRSLPNSIERLEFHCTNCEPMLADLDLWIEAAKDPEWLPRLKYIHMCIYDAERDELRWAKAPTRAVDTGRARMISEKIRRVYEVLKNRAGQAAVVFCEHPSH